MSWLDDDNDREYDSIPEGLHCVKFKDCDLDETGDDPKMTLKFEAKGHEGLLFMNLTFNEKSQKWIRWQLGILGALSLAKPNITDPDDMSEVSRACLDACGELVGAYFEAEVTHNEYKGKTYQNIKLEDELPPSDAKTYPENRGTTAATMAPPSVDTTEDVPW